MPSISTRHEKIESARVMLRELGQIAQAERCDMLAYLIEMAYVEASDILRGVRPATVHPRGATHPDLPHRSAQLRKADH